MTESALLRPHAEQLFAAELTALRAADDKAVPPNWSMSPHAVVHYLLVGKPWTAWRSHPSTSGPAGSSR